MYGPLKTGDYEDDEMFTRKPTSYFAAQLQRRGSAKFLFIIIAISVILLLYYYVNYTNGQLIGPQEKRRVIIDQAIQDRLLAEQDQILLDQEPPILVPNQPVLHQKEQVLEEELEEYDDEQSFLDEEQSLNDQVQPLLKQKQPLLINQVLLEPEKTLLDNERPLVIQKVAFVEPEKSLARHDQSLDKQKAPLEESEQSLINTDQSLEKQNPPHIEPKETVVTHEKSPETEHKPPVTKVLSPVTTKLPSVTKERPVIQEQLTSTKIKNGDKQTSSAPNNMKYILLWTKKDSFPIHYFGEGQKAFISNKNCTVTNCFVTVDRDFFKGDITKFDAIVFNGRSVNSSDLPQMRAPHQKYIFVNTESSDRFPVCDPRYDNFYNWTASYRLDSDIPLRYILIRDDKGNVVGPKRDMIWMEDKPKVGNEFDDSIKNKSKAAAWFVSHCNTRSGREIFVKELQEALKLYGYTVDVYGSCGTMECPRGNDSYCDYILQRDYFFYMSLENSFDEDYVTEKLLRAMQQNIVPIVYGGADYSRFLPPGSYIDSRDYSVPKLAEFMYQLMNTPDDYRQYFWWKSFYTYHKPQMKDSICSVCVALNNEMAERSSTYPNFRKLWHPTFEKRCKSKD